MNHPPLQILSTALLPVYGDAVPAEALIRYAGLVDSELSVDAFSFYTSVAAVYSSKIEGEPIELDSYVKHKRFGVEFQPDYTRKIDDLYDAYQFAMSHALNRECLESAHGLLTRNILLAHRQGTLRTGMMYVTTPDGRIEYVAASPYEVPAELEKFYHDLGVLLTAELGLQEVFYFAAMLHLVFVKIHPFEDGNGRAARLLEKWFLAAKLGGQAWLLPSERVYYEQHADYYAHIRLLGLEYEALDFGRALPFLMILPKACG